MPIFWKAPEDTPVYAHLQTVIAKVRTLPAKEKEVLFRRYWVQSTKGFDKQYVVHCIAEKLIYDRKSAFHFDRR